MFDTHCHLTSKRLRKDLEGVLERARGVGVEKIVVPGTSVEDSRKALEIAEANDGVYAAVGVHPEVIGAILVDKLHSGVNYQFLSDSDSFELSALTLLLGFDKVVAIGEIGLDNLIFDDVLLKDLARDEIWRLQDQLLRAQIRLAVEYHKSLVLHNRGMAQELMEMLESEWSPLLEGRTVLHCCEADERLLEFAKANKIYIGVDGDVTYPASAKQNFIRKVPMELLVLETDAPYLLPEPLLSEKKYPNEPANLKLIAEKVAELKGLKVEEVEKVTTENGVGLFGLPSL